MSSQPVRHTGEERLQCSTGEDEQYEKKSVLKKVKDKAKKLKDTLGKKMHRDEEEEDDEESETEVHGSPIYTSTTVNKLPVGISMQPRVNLVISQLSEEDPHAAKHRPELISPANYQTEVTDPTNTGGQEAEIKWVVHSLEEMNIQEKPETKLPSDPNSISSTGSHEQFLPDPPEIKKTVPISETFDSSNQSLEKPEQVDGRLDGRTEEQSKSQPFPESFNGGAEEQNRTETFSEGFNVGKIKNKNGGEKSYTTKIYGQVASVSSALTEKAVTAKNVVASKLGYGGGNVGSSSPESEPGLLVEGESDRKSVTENLSPMYEKVKELGAKGCDKGVSMKAYLFGKLKPGEEEKALSEVISDAIYAKKENSPDKLTASGNDKAEIGVLGRLKGAVTSFLGRNGEAHISPESVNNSLSDVNTGKEEGETVN